MAKCKVIAIANQKGCYVPVAYVQRRPKRKRRSTGKTTTTVNLGIGLANEGKKVLLVDADIQGGFDNFFRMGRPG